MVSYSNKIKYLHDCFQVDHTEGKISNIFKNKVENLIFLSNNEELLTDVLRYIPLPFNQAKTAKKSFDENFKTKKLVYLSFFINGSITNTEGCSENICSPLFIHSAEITKNEELNSFMLSIDLDSIQINYDLITYICENPNLRSEFYEDLYKEFIKGSVDTSQIFQFSQILKKYTYPINLTLFDLYPQLLNKDKLKENYEKYILDPENNLSIVPASAVCLVNRSVENRGILIELQEIAENNTCSIPLNILFGQNEKNENNIEIDTENSPSILSNAQEKIIKSSAQFPLTLVIGPPGTGKTFTIASVAFEHLLRGESVLIVSKTDQAVDVIADKVEEQLELSDCIVRAGRKKYLKKLKDFLSNLLHGIRSNSKYLNENLPIEQKAREYEIKRLKKEINKIHNNIFSLKKTFNKRNNNEISWGEFLSKIKLKQLSFIEKIRLRYIKFRINNSISISKLVEKLFIYLNKRSIAIISKIKLINEKRLEEACLMYRKDLSNFLSGLRSRTSLKQENLFKEINFDALLKTFPIWLIKLSDIFKILPLKNELFDLVIIDEATQCDIASCLPAIFRAKRLLVVGDPKQLRHVSFLSRTRQKFIAEKHELIESDIEKLNYRDISILDLVDENISSQMNVIFLNEHYRSNSNIIQFSNDNFYNNSLLIMTDNPCSQINNNVFWKTTNGKRDKNEGNIIEAKDLVKDLKNLIKQEESKSKKYCHSIGILSPFRKQVELLKKLISDEFSSNIIEKHKILTGTPYSFQGEERDIMFLSFSIDKLCHFKVFEYLNKEDVFNVSITRARLNQYIYTSMHYKNLKETCILRKYLENIEIRNKNQKPKESNDLFLKDISGIFREWDYELWPSYIIAGMNIDLVITKNNKSIGIDLIGYPGEYSDYYCFERYKMFYRAGLTILPITYTQWYFYKEKTIKDLNEILLKI